MRGLRALGQEAAARPQRYLRTSLVAHAAAGFGAARHSAATHAALGVGDQRETLHADDAVEIARGLRTLRLGRGLFGPRRRRARRLLARRALHGAAQRLALRVDARHDALQLALGALAHDLDRIDRVLE